MSYVKNKNWRKLNTFLMLILAGGMLVSGWLMMAPVFAQSATQIGVSISLYDASYKPIPNGSYEVRFALYADDRTERDPYPSNSDSRIWEETQTAEVKNGILRAFLGATTPFSPEFLSSDVGYYLGVRVGTDSEMYPRKQMSAVRNALNAQYLQGKTIGTKTGDILTIGKRNRIDVKLLPSTTSYLGDTIEIDNEVDGVLAIENGGIGLSDTPGVGQILVGTGSGYAFGTISSASITADSLDFTELSDTLTLDASTDINLEGLTLSTSGTGAIALNNTGNFTVAGNIDFNGTVNDIAGALNLSGGILTSTGALTVTPQAGNNLNIALSTTGDFAVNTDQLYVDTSTGNVGIGTIVPDAKLSINGTVTPTGPELITNSTFTGDASGWTLGDCAVYGSNQVTVTYTACSNPNLSTSIVTEAGKTYQITFTLSAVSGDFAYLYFGNNNYYTNELSNGTQTLAFVADFTGTDTIYFESWNWNNGGTWIIDNVSVKESPAIRPALDVIGWDGTKWLSLGGDILGNTAIGKDAFQSNTTGYSNTANGWGTLRSNTTGYLNTANGVNALSSNTTGSSNTANGWGTLSSNTIGSYNTASGMSALYSNTTGDHNTANGISALYSNTTGYWNTANGSSALYSNTTGSWNTANGVNALRSNTTGSQNTANGMSALFYNTTGYSNTANGMSALYYNTTGSWNTANGLGALHSNTTGDNNTANGMNALFYNTTGYWNTANGSYALTSNTTGISNTANGLNALTSNTTGWDNTANGVQALYSNTTGWSNTALGKNSGYGITTGSTNVLLGASNIVASANQITTGSNNISIGNDVAVASPTASNQLNIGNLIYGTGLNGTGSTLSTGNIGIGTPSPTATLDVHGGANGTRLRVNTVTWNAPTHVASLHALTSGIASDGFGPMLTFRMGTQGFDGYDAGRIYTKRAGSDSTHDLFIEPSGTSGITIKSSGNVGIGDTTPLSLFTVGSGDLFQVNSSGAIASATGITSSGTITFSGLSTGGIVTNTSGGVLGTTATLGASYITADSLDFTELKDALTLDASTDISVTGSNVFSITNSGTGNSFVVNDVASDTTPFVIDASGNVGIGTTSPAATLDVRQTGAVSTDALSVSLSNASGTNTHAAYFNTNVSASQFVNPSSGAAFNVTGNVNVLTGAYNSGGFASVIATTNQVNTGTAYAFDASNSFYSGGTTTSLGNYIGFYSSGSNAGTTTLGNHYDFRASNYSGPTGLTITNRYGLYIDYTNANVTNAYGVYQNSNTLTNYFAGNVGIGDTTPDGLLDVEGTGAVTTANYGINLSNLTTNATTDAINKYGAYITSTGAWTGGAGTATNNYGLYVDTVSGADNNYGAYFAQNVGIGTASPTSQLHISANLADAAITVGRTGSTTHTMQISTGTSSDTINSGIGNGLPLFLQVSGTTRTAITSTGVGIGTTIPNAAGLEISNDTQITGTDIFRQNLRLTSASYPAVQFYVSSANKLSLIGNRNDGSLWFNVNGTATTSPANAMVISNNGNVGIGDTTPSHLLSVGNGDLFTVSSTGNVLFNSVSGTTTTHTILAGDSAVNSGIKGDSLTVGAGNGSGVCCSAAGGDITLRGGNPYTNTGAFLGGDVIISAGDNQYTRTDLNGNIRFLAGDSSPERMRIVGDSGNVGIGTTTPTANLQVAQGTAGTGTVTVTTNTTLTGTGTQFLNTFKVGDNIIITATAETRAITAIASDTVMTIASATNTAGSAYTLVGGTRFSVLGNGNVGIGTTTPADLLSIGAAAGNGSTRQSIRINNNGFTVPSAANANSNGDKLVMYNDPSGKLAIGLDTGYKMWFQAHGAATAALQFYTGSGTTASERMRIDASGNVGIGTTVPYARLAVKAAAGDNYVGGINFQRNTTLDTWAFTVGADNNFYYGYANNASGANEHSDFGTALRLQTTGGMSLGTTYSASTPPTSGMIIEGNVGIGTTTPTTNLQVAQGTTGTGTVSTPGSSTTLTGVGTQFTNTFKVGDTLTIVGETVRTINTITSDTVLDVTVAFSATPRSAVAYTLTGGTRFSVLGNGNVGIGTTSPSSLLQVYGTQANGILADYRTSAAGGYGILFGYTATGGFISSRGSGQDFFISGGNSTGYGDRGLLIDANGNVGIGDTTPDGLLDVEGTGAVTTANYGINLSNLTTNATTDAINKYGAYIISTGAWTGGAGTATNNYGLYVDTVSGADNNYGAYFAGNVGIGTTAPGAKLQVSNAGAGLTDGVLIASFVGNNSSAFEFTNSGTFLINNGGYATYAGAINFNAGEATVGTTSGTWPNRILALKTYGADIQMLPGGLNSAAKAVIIKPGANSTNVFQIQQADATPIFTVDSTNKFVGIGDTTPSALFTVGDTDLFQISSLGNVSTTGQINGTDGLVTKVNAGACDDTTFTQDTDGNICIDSTNGRIYYRYGGAWHYSAQTAGFQIPNYEAYRYDFTAQSFDESTPLVSGDFLLPFVENSMEDGAVHGLYARFSDVKDTLFADEHAQINAINLKTDTNATTLSTLQASIDTQLTVASNAITTLQVAGAETDANALTLQGAFDTMDTRIITLENDANAEALKVSALQSEVTILKDQVTTLTDFYTALDLSSVVVKDAGGDVDLSTSDVIVGTLSADGLSIIVSDPDKATIGVATILPVAVDTDSDGNDDYTNLPMMDPEVTSRDGETVFVKTKAVTDTMKTFVNFSDDPGSYSWTEKKKSSGDYIGFIIHLSSAVLAPVNADWILVEEKNSLAP